MSCISLSLLSPDKMHVCRSTFMCNPTLLSCNVTAARTSPQSSFWVRDHPEWPG